MEWFTKHADAAVVIGAIVGSMLWMNGQFNEVNNRMDIRFAAIEKDVTIIKTVLIMKEIMPNQLAKEE